MRLREFNGLHLVLRGQAAWTGLPAIVTHQTSDEVLQAEAERLGATFVVLPTTREELVAAVYRTTLRSDTIAAAEGTHPDAIRTAQRRATSAGSGQPAREGPPDYGASPRRRYRAPACRGSLTATGDGVRNQDSGIGNQGWASHQAAGSQASVDSDARLLGPLTIPPHGRPVSRRETLGARRSPRSKNALVRRSLGVSSGEPSRLRDSEGNKNALEANGLAMSFAEVGKILGAMPFTALEKCTGGAESGVG